jgi:hypothetical protein
MSHRILCFLGALFLAGFFVFMEVILNYLAKYRNQETFGFGLLFFIAYLCIVFTAFWRIIRAIVSVFRKEAKASVCSFAILLSVLLPLPFRERLISLGDEMFFLANEGNFKAEVKNIGEMTSVVPVHIKSSLNAHKLFLYVGSNAMKAGRLSLAEIDGLGGTLSAFRACAVYATPLKDSFYLVRIEC